MSMSYRTKRRLQRAGLIGGIALLLLILAAYCWVVWLERYVVYTRDGAALNFDLVERPGAGQLAQPPSAAETVPIYVNEGLDAIDMNKELSQINGFYIDSDMLQNDIAGAREIVATLPSGTAVMVELKSIWGQFQYSSHVSNVTLSNRIDVEQVDKLITDINSRNLYTVAVLPAFRDRYFFLLNNRNTALGLAVKGKGYLWVDNDNCYWFDPSNNNTILWLQEIILELKNLGFDEVVLSEYRIPNTENIVFKEDRAETIKKTAQTLVTTCATDSFAVSFLVDDGTSFPMPDGRTRIYLQNVGPKNVDAVVALLNFENPESKIVFMCNTNDTRYDEYSVMRPISMVSTK